MTTPVQTVIQLLTQDAKLDLFEMDLSQVTGTSDPSNIFRFHAGTNSLLQPVVWQGNAYSYLPGTMDGFDIQTSGSLPRPKLNMSNVYSAVTALLNLAGGDITGAKITRRQTYARYLDAVNWPARTNMVTWSEDTTHWTPTLLTTALSGTVVDARGDLKSVAVTETAASGVKGLAISTVALASGQYVTANVEIKPGTRKQVEVTMTGPFAAPVTLDADMSGSGVVLASSGALRYSLQKIGDSGWFSLVIQGVANSAATATVTIRPLQAGVTSYLGSTSNVFYTGRVNVFTPAGLDDAYDKRNLFASLPYQYIGSAYTPNPDTDPTKYLPDEVYFIERKVSEDEVSVQFELSSAIDLEDLKLPRRMVTVNYCSWDDYMGEGCMYVPTDPGSGGYFDANDNPVGSSALDVCGRSVNSCKVRFGANNPLMYGGFPAARAYSY